MAEKQRIIDIHSYNWTFIDSDIAEQYMCTVCARILKKPITTLCCRAQYCENCVKNYDEDSIYTQQCPSCEGWFAVFEDKKKWENILDLLVKCPFGCYWMGCIKDCDQHLRMDCMFVSKHEGTECEESKYCSKNQSAAFTCHEQNSETTIKLCPGCNKKLLQNYKEHTEGCPELDIPCEYENVGCKITSKRKLMTKHLAENLQEHSRLLSQCLQSKIEQSLLLSQQCVQESEKKFERYLAQSKDALTSHQQMLKTNQQKTEIEQHQAQQNLSQLFTRHKCTIKQVLKYKPNCLWELDRKSIQLYTKLYSGQFCEIWKGLQYETIQIAIKCHKPDSATSQTFLQEALVLKQFEHTNILKLYGVNTRDEPIMIITEYVANGNLLELLKNKNDFLAKSAKLDIFQQVTNGMTYLENLNWIHRALKSCNILIGEELNCKISGFKLARKLPLDEKEYTIPGGIRTQVKWSAPEVLTRRTCSIKSDVWSFGIILWEVICGKKLNMTKFDAEKIIKHSDSMLLFSMVPDDPTLCQLMTRCLTKDPEERPLFKDILSTFKQLLAC